MWVAKRWRPCDWWGCLTGSDCASCESARAPSQSWTRNQSRRCPGRWRSPPDSPEGCPSNCSFLSPLTCELKERVFELESRYLLISNAVVFGIKNSPKVARECPFQNLQENEASETSKNYGLSRLSFICWLKNHCMRQLVNRFRRSEMNWNCINCYNRMWAFEKHRKVTCEVHIVNHLYSSWKQFGHRGGELARGDEQTSGMHFKSLGLLFVVHLILLVYQFS